MAAWMGYILVVSVLFAAAAHVGERGAQALKRPTRWVWVAALITTVVVAFVRPAPGAPEAPDAGSAEVSAAPATDGGEKPAASSHGAEPDRPLDLALVLLWLLSGGAYWSYLGYSALRLRSARASWSAEAVDGDPVLVMPAGGPAVLGVLRPRVVVPRWLLSWPKERRRWVIRHELQHASSRDPLLNAFGLTVLGVMPWNPVLWWARARLVRAIEMDCDARVLSEDGIGSERYAEILVEVARWTVPLRPDAALAASKSHLHRRVEMALANRRRPRLALGAGLAAAGILLALVSTGIDAPELPRFVGSPAELEGQEAMPGRLPFTPSTEQITAALVAHHPRIVAEGLPEDQRVWFVLDEEMRILHTGVGPAEGLSGRVRAERPEVGTDLGELEIEYVTSDWGHRILTYWFVPPPSGGLGPPS